MNVVILFVVMKDLKLVDSVTHKSNNREQTPIKFMVTVQHLTQRGDRLVTEIILF
jgi:hypothetical protein